MLLGPLETQKLKKSIERLLKIKGVDVTLRAHFLLEIVPFGVHFGSKNDTGTNKKRIKQLTARICRKSIERDPKTTPKWLPKSTPEAPKWCPKCLPAIGGTHFGSPSGSKVTPLPPNVPHRVSQGTPQVPPRASKQTYLRPQSLSWWPCGAPVCFWSVPLVR